MENSLLSFYDDLKQSKAIDNTNLLTNVNGLGAQIWKKKAIDCSNKLCDKCCKHILLDIYCQILPLDDSYKCGNMGQMNADIDSMLKAKGLTASQYLKSCSEASNAPFAKYLVSAVDKIGECYLQEKDAELKEAQEANRSILDPIEPEMDSPEVVDAMNGIKEDDEYKMFIDTLKKKTQDTIVNDISNVINNTKEGDELQFNPSAESAFQIGVDYINKKLWKENVNTDGSKSDDIMGLAIRESTLREIDKTFEVEIPLNEFRSTINFGKGAVITEAAINALK